MNVGTVWIWQVQARPAPRSEPSCGGEPRAQAAARRWRCVRAAAHRVRPAASSKRLRLAPGCARERPDAQNGSDTGSAWLGTAGARARSRRAERGVCACDSRGAPLRADLIRRDPTCDLPARAWPYAMLVRARSGEAWDVRRRAPRARSGILGGRRPCLAVCAPVRVRGSSCSASAEVRGTQSRIAKIAQVPESVGGQQ